MKKIVPLLFVLILALAACTGTSPTETNAEPTAAETVAQAQPTATTAPAATDTPTAAAPAPTDAPVVADTPTPIAPGCYPAPISDLIDLTANEKIAPVTADDWQKGGDTSAPITVIEYGDFQ